MPSASRVYLFTSNNVRILKTSDPEKYRKYENCLIDPDISHMRGIPLEYWQLDGDKITEMPRAAKMARKADIAVRGAQNTWNLKKMPIRPEYSLRVRVIRGTKRAAIMGLMIFAIICLPGGSCG